MRRAPLLLFPVLYAFCAAGAASAATNVVVSIKPVHSLAAGVMAGVGSPNLIVDGAASPHAYALKPSQAAAIQEADVIFWVGPELEAFLAKPIETLGAAATVVELADAPGLNLLPLREGGSFEAHEHDDADEHRGEAERETRDHHDAFDMHVWLDPENAKVIVHSIAAALGEADPANAGVYDSNAAELIARIDALLVETDTALAPVRSKRFIVFHDGYRYFEDRFGLSAAGSITVSPEAIPGAERVAAIRTKVEELGATCVFAEPQFEPKLVSVVTEGTAARSGVLDPLGADIENGPDLYFSLIRTMAGAMRDCLSPQS